MRMFIICGPESSGNRLVAAYLHRAGVDIDASTSPQMPDRVQSSSSDVGLIIHDEPKLTRTVMMARDHGRSVSMVVLTREFGALVESMIERGHVSNKEMAHDRIQQSAMDAMTIARQWSVPFISVSYESLILHPSETVDNLLRALGIPMIDMSQGIRVQNRNCDATPVDRNAERYGNG